MCGKDIWNWTGIPKTAALRAAVFQISVKNLKGCSNTHSAWRGFNILCEKVLSEQTPHKPYPCVPKKNESSSRSSGGATMGAGVALPLLKCENFETSTTKKTRIVLFEAPIWPLPYIRQKTALSLKWGSPLYEQIEVSVNTGPFTRGNLPRPLSLHVHRRPLCPYRRILESEHEAPVPAQEAPEPK